MIFQNQEDYDAVDVSGIDPGLKVYFFVDLSSISEGYFFYLLTFSWNVVEGYPEHSFEFFFNFSHMVYSNATSISKYWEMLLISVFWAERLITPPQKGQTLITEWYLD